MGSLHGVRHRVRHFRKGDEAYPQLADPNWLDANASDSLLYWSYRSWYFNHHYAGPASFDTNSMDFSPSANFGDIGAQLESGFADIQSTIAAASPSSSYSGSGGSFSGGGFGGSSGGSCAAVAANECFFALGSDTGGSIRQPSSFCGVTGIKPTYGTVSRYGLIAYGSSLDQIGPVAKDVSDCAAILEAISSHDLKDSTSMARTDCDFTSALKDDVKGMKIGIPSSYFGEGLDEEVKAAILKAADILKEKGAVVETFDLGLVDYAIPAYYVIASAEASSNLSRFDGVKYGYRTKEYEGLHNMYKKTRSEGFGPEVKRRIMLGSFVLSSGYYDAYYLKALRTKALIKKEFDKAFAKYDLILAPASPDTAPLLGSSLSDPLKMYLGDIYTISVNLAGLPGMTVPCGLDSKGLPIGMQLIGDCFKEKDIIRAGYAFECTRKYEMPELAKVSD